MRSNQKTFGGVPSMFVIINTYSPGRSFGEVKYVTFATLAPGLTRGARYIPAGTPLMENSAVGRPFVSTEPSRPPTATWVPASTSEYDGYDCRQRDLLTFECERSGHARTSSTVFRAIDDSSAGKELPAG